MVLWSRSFPALRGCCPSLRKDGMERNCTGHDDPRRLRKRRMRCRRRQSSGGGIGTGDRA